MVALFDKLFSRQKEREQVAVGDYQGLVAAVVDGKSGMDNPARAACLH